MDNPREVTQWLHVFWRYCASRKVWQMRNTRRRTRDPRKHQAEAPMWLCHLHPLQVIGLSKFSSLEFFFSLPGEISLLREISGSGSGWRLWDLMCFVFLMGSLKPKPAIVLRKQSESAALHQKCLLNREMGRKREHDRENEYWEEHKMKWITLLRDCSSSPNVTFYPLSIGYATGEEIQL